MEDRRLTGIQLIIDRYAKKCTLMNPVMNMKSKDILKATLIVPFCLILVLIPYSMLIGWNLFTGVLFWYVITPALTIYLPGIFLKNRNHLLESLVGLLIFYALMVFMIYEHYKTDYFKVMMVSLVVNMMVIALFMWIKGQSVKTQHP